MSLQKQEQARSKNKTKQEQDAKAHICHPPKECLSRSKNKTLKHIFVIPQRNVSPEARTRRKSTYLSSPKGMSLQKQEQDAKAHICHPPKECLSRSKNKPEARTR
eukprot:Platyproteum_vivax@DN7488_c3_g1_i11.p1